MEVPIYGVPLLATLHLLCIPLAIIYAHILEWVLHKYVLHGLGKNKKSKWASHWHTHHRSSRQNNNYDADYSKGFFHYGVRGEILGLLALGILHIPTILISPLFYYTLIICAIRYFKIHKKSHLDIKWCKKYLPWHYDHHMGKNQDANWGVTNEWVDKLLSTRIKYF
jgi:sterol desaturase/sphingolipid hydroxylase (fatty acid hydroxylase superfamily)